MSARSRAVRGPVVGLAGLVLAFGVALPVTAANRSRVKDVPSAGEYVVQMSSPPVASYTGGKPGLAATSPKRTGRKLARNSAAVRNYRAYLADQQRAALARLGANQPRVGYSYRTAFAGFSAHLTAKQVTALRKAPEIARVSKVQLKKIQTADTDNLALDNATNPDSAAYLDLPDDLWQRLGGSENAGDGVIVGVIDTGIQPGHPSFADVPAGNYTGPAFGPVPDTWNGTCQTGTGFTALDCNNKLIGARYFVDGFGVENLAPGSFVSPRDDEGHGSHTASIAAGNFGVDPVIDGNDLGVNRISGIAPRARVAAYKGCWSGIAGDGCATSDLVAAIDSAVENGVDVINYSIGSVTSTVIGPDEFAFLGASDAGVFVANSAGNAGPDSSTVGSPASVPWLTSVAAANNSRTFQATATVTGAPGPDITATGASASTALSTPANLVDGADVPAAGVAATDAERCEDDSLDPAAVAGAVVLCLRGGTAGRIRKSRNVAEAGGVGMILYNDFEPQDLSAYPFWLPSVSVTRARGLEIKAAIDDPGSTAQATITAGAKAATVPAVLAPFSSRGPQGAVPDLAKPDVAAPGVNILAAAADQVPPSSDIKPGRRFQVISGTSMSSPHVAGAGALLTQLHPTFSSAALKSSLMTTADPNVLREDGTTPADPFDAGSGEIDPNAAALPGLVLEAGTGDYFDYLEAVDPADFPPVGATTAPADLNLPSISNSALAGTASTSRTFTSVDSITRHWTVEVTGLDGITATSSDAEFTIKPGQTREIGLDFAVTDAPVDTYQFGELVLSSPDRRVRLPISLRPTAVAVPDPIEVTTDKAAGSEPVTVRAGYTGQLSSLGWGLAPAQVKAGESVGESPTGSPDPGGTVGTRLYEYDVVDPSQLFATRLSDVDDGDAATDLDMFVYRDANGDGAFAWPAEALAVSASGSSDEHVELLNPQPGRYAVEIIGYSVQDPVSVFTLNTWVVSDSAPDQATSAASIVMGGDPKAVTPGGEVPLSLDWSNVNAKGTYMGIVTYHAAAAPTDDNLVATSLVELEETADAPKPPVVVTPPPKPPVVTPLAKLRLRLTSARVSGRTLTLRLRASRRARIRTQVRRGGRTTASAGSRVVTAQTRVLRVRLNRRVRRGRTYTVRIQAFAGSRVAASASVRMRVR